MCYNITFFKLPLTFDPSVIHILSSCLKKNKKTCYLVEMVKISVEDTGGFDLLVSAYFSKNQPGHVQLYLFNPCFLFVPSFSVTYEKKPHYILPSGVFAVNTL